LKLRFRAVLGLPLALSLFTAGTVPALAGSEQQGAFARFKLTGGGGLVTVRNTGTTTVNAGLIGLVGLGSYLVNAYSVGCGGNASRANRLFSVDGTADSEGALFGRWETIHTVDVPSLRSIRLTRTDGAGETVCAKAAHTIQIPAGTPGDAWYGDIHQPLNFLIIVEALPYSRARVSTFADSYGPERLTIRGSNRNCGSRAGVTRFFLNVEAFAVYKSKAVDMTRAQFQALRSVRWARADGSGAGCKQLTNFDITFPRG
jgi:hypothetical protein